MYKSTLHAVHSVVLAAAFMAVSPHASASTQAEVQFSNQLVTAFNFFGVTISAGGAGSFSNDTFTSPAADVPVGGTTLTWDPAAQLTFAIAGNGTMTFGGLVYDDATSLVTGDVHFANGGTVKDFNDVALFTVAPLSPAFSTLSTGGTVSADFVLNAAGIGGVASQLGITVPVPTTTAGALTFSATQPSVPEPETWALAVAGVVGVLASRRRRQA